MALWLERFTKPSPTNEPPTRQELLRNDLLVAGLVIFALFLGVGIRNQVYGASKTARLEEGLPAIKYPAQWVARSGDGQVGDGQVGDDLLFGAYDPGAPSTFNSQLAVTGRPLDTDESLEQARAGRGLNLATSLSGFRELAVEEMLINRDQPALVSTYAYIVDPTRDTGVTDLPVVVEAQDIMFVDDGQFVVVTVAADASLWDEQQRDFQLIFDSLRLRPMPATRPEPAPTAAATPPPEDTAPGSFSGGASGGTNSGEGSEGGD